jgi:HAD superfamily hydrolase (TIGR01509 family)
MMEKSGLDRYLDVTVSNQDVSRGKPDPEIYLMAFSRLGIAPDEALIVEDSPYGIAAAKASGGHLMVVRDPNDVTWDNIRRQLEVVEHKG